LNENSIMMSKTKVYRTALAIRDSQYVNVIEDKVIPFSTCTI